MVTNAVTKKSGFVFGVSESLVSRVVVHIVALIVSLPNGTELVRGPRHLRRKVSGGGARKDFAAISFVVKECREFSVIAERDVQVSGYPGSERPYAVRGDTFATTKKAFRTSVGASVVTLTRASARRPPRCRVRSRKVRTAARRPRPRAFCAPGPVPRGRRSRSPPSPEPVRASPADSKFTQQELPAWRPTLTPAWVRLPLALPRPSGVYVRAARAARRALPEDALAPGGVVSFSPPKTGATRTFPRSTRGFLFFRVSRSR